MVTSIHSFQLWHFFAEDHSSAYDRNRGAYGSSHDRGAYDRSADHRSAYDRSGYDCSADDRSTDHRSADHG